MDEKQRLVLSARSYGTKKRGGDSDRSQQTDPFKQSYSKGKILEPPWSPDHFSALNETVDIMPPIVDALRINIEQQGAGLRKRHEEIDEEDPLVVAEWDVATDLLESCTEDGVESLRGFVRDDLTLTGSGYIEVLRETASMARARKRAAGDDGQADAGSKRRPYYFLHAPSYRTRICVPDEDAAKPIDATRWVLVDGEWTERKVLRTFRKFAQIKPGASELRYFKEMDDPRTLNALTGKYDEGTSAAERATEIWMTGFFNGRSAYGIPKFAAAHYAIGGLVESERGNYEYLFNNGIPAMVVLVSGGVLTGEANQAVMERFDEVRGKIGAVLVLEAKPFDKPGMDAMEPGSPAGQVKIEIKPLAELIREDALFLKYIAAQHKIIRGVWRVPPLLMGHSDDYSYATAYVSMTMFEDQVCAPERGRFDSFMNLRVFPQIGVSSWLYESKGVKSGQMAEIAALVNAGVAAGAGNPNVWGQVIGDQLGYDIPQVEGPEGEQAFALTLKKLEQTQALFSGTAKATAANEVAELVIAGLTEAGRKWERMTSTEREAVRG